MASTQSFTGVGLCLRGLSRLNTALHRAQSNSSWQPMRCASSTSRWKQRQGRDAYAKDAKVQGLKSRAAFKLLEMDEKHKIFKKNQTVIDLGYAPGSWSQVALERTKPHGKVIGIDLIPAQAPRGVITFQGDFLSPMVQKLVKNLIIETDRRKPKTQPPASTDDETIGDETAKIAIERPSYIDLERHASQSTGDLPEETGSSKGRLVDVVLSDMLMNTSGVAFRDHAGSMDLCNTALEFASDTLRPGGHFVCKFYAGSEDKALEQRLKKLFSRVYREKPESSRSESKEAYLIGIKRKGDVTLEQRA